MFTWPGLLAPTLLLGAALLVLLPAVSPRRPAARWAAIGLVLCLNLRYLLWRFTDTLPDAAALPEFAWTRLLFACEAQAVLTTSWFAFTQVRAATDHSPAADRHERRLRALPPAALPRVDVFIPTHIEAEEIVAPTLAAAKAIDWPAARLRIWVLDDHAAQDDEALRVARKKAGLKWEPRSVWLPRLCAQAGVEYLHKQEPGGYKAGNLNYGLAFSHGEFVLVLDADFRAQPQLLYRMVGFFQEHPRVALVQTPQHYFNADAVAANLRGAGAWSDEQRTFMDVAQPVRDAWNAAFCVGTTFVVRRANLAPLGGFPEACVCEDYYTSLVLKSQGYATLYLNERLGEGLAAESIGDYVKQRSRWCRGTIQALFLPGSPLRARGLSLTDRLFFLDGAMHWFSFLALALLLLAPAVYWWSGVPAFRCDLAGLAGILLPRLVAGSLVGYWLSARKLAPVVNQVERAVTLPDLIPNLLYATFTRSGKGFDSTAKGGWRAREVVQWMMMAPFAAVLGLTVAGMVRNLRLEHRVIAVDGGLGLSLLLSLHGVVVLLLCMLACIEPPTLEVRPVQEARMPAVARALAAKLFC